MSLTDRECKILDKLIEGKHDKQIGRELGLSDNTIKGCVRLICAKMDAPSRMAAVVKYAVEKAKK